MLASATPSPGGKAGTVTLRTTRNAGRSWARHHVPCALDAPTVALAVAQGGRLFVACAGQPGAGSQQKTLASSANGGRSWTVRSPCPFSCPPLTFGYLGEIAATSSGKVFLTGPRSSLLVTGDRGRSWHLVRPLIGDQGGGTTQVTFFGARGIVAGFDRRERPAIWHTSDGGTHWQVAHPVLG